MTAEFSNASEKTSYCGSVTLLTEPNPEIEALATNKYRTIKSSHELMNISMQSLKYPTKSYTSACSKFETSEPTIITPFEAPHDAFEKLSSDLDMIPNQEMDALSLLTSATPIEPPRPPSTCILNPEGSNRFSGNYANIHNQRYGENCASTGEIYDRPRTCMFSDDHQKMSETQSKQSDTIEEMPEIVMDQRTRCSFSTRNTDVTLVTKFQKTVDLSLSKVLEDEDQADQATLENLIVSQNTMSSQGIKEPISTLNSVQEPVSPTLIVQPRPQIFRDHSAKRKMSSTSSYRNSTMNTQFFHCTNTVRIPAELILQRQKAEKQKLEKTWSVCHLDNLKTDPNDPNPTAQDITRTKSASSKNTLHTLNSKTSSKSRSSNKTGSSSKNATRKNSIFKNLINDGGIVVDCKNRIYCVNKQGIYDPGLAAKSRKNSSGDQHEKLDKKLGRKKDKNNGRDDTRKKPLAMQKSLSANHADKESCQGSRRPRKLSSLKVSKSTHYLPNFIVQLSEDDPSVLV